MAQQPNFQKRLASACYARVCCRFGFVVRLISGSRDDPQCFILVLFYRFSNKCAYGPRRSFVPFSTIAIPKSQTQNYGMRNWFKRRGQFDNGRWDFSIENGNCLKTYPAFSIQATRVRGRIVSFKVSSGNRENIWTPNKTFEFPRRANSGFGIFFWRMTKLKRAETALFANPTLCTPYGTRPFVRRQSRHGRNGFCFLFRLLTRSDQVVFLDVWSRERESLKKSRLKRKYEFVQNKSLLMENLVLREGIRVFERNPVCSAARFANRSVTTAQTPAKTQNLESTRH